MRLQARAVRRLLAHRLSPEDAAAAKLEWLEIVEGDGSLWAGVSEPYKHTIRAFLVYFQTQLLRHATERFNFRNGSVGAGPWLPRFASLTFGSAGHCFAHQASARASWHESSLPTRLHC